MKQQAKRNKLICGVRTTSKTTLHNVLCICTGAYKIMTSKILLKTRIWPLIGKMRTSADTLHTIHATPYIRCTLYTLHIIYAAHYTRKTCEHIPKVGHIHIYTVYVRYFWQGNHQIHGVYIWLWPTLRKPMHSA